MAIITVCLVLTCMLLHRGRSQDLSAQGQTISLTEGTRNSNSSDGFINIADSFYLRSLRQGNADALRHLNQLRHTADTPMRVFNNFQRTLNSRDPNQQRDIAHLWHNMAVLRGLAPNSLAFTPGEPTRMQTWSSNPGHNMFSSVTNTVVTSTPTSLPITSDTPRSRETPIDVTSIDEINLNGQTPIVSAKLTRLTLPTTDNKLTSMRLTDQHRNVKKTENIKRIIEKEIMNKSLHSILNGIAQEGTTNVPTERETRPVVPEGSIKSIGNGVIDIKADEHAIDLPMYEFVIQNVNDVITEHGTTRQDFKDQFVGDVTDTLGLHQLKPIINDRFHPKLDIQRTGDGQGVTVKYIGDLSVKSGEEVKLQYVGDIETANSSLSVLLPVPVTDNKIVVSDTSAEEGANTGKHENEIFLHHVGEIFTKAGKRFNTRNINTVVPRFTEQTGSTQAVAVDNALPTQTSDKLPDSKDKDEKQNKMRVFLGMSDSGRVSVIRDISDFLGFHGVNVHALDLESEKIEIPVVLTNLFNKHMFRADVKTTDNINQNVLNDIQRPTAQTITGSTNNPMFKLLGVNAVFEPRSTTDRANQQIANDRKQEHRTVHAKGGGIPVTFTDKSMLVPHGSNQGTFVDTKVDLPEGINVMHHSINGGSEISSIKVLNAEFG